MDRRFRPIVAISALAALSLVVSACGSDRPVEPIRSDRDPVSHLSVADRQMAVVTTGCGHASDGVGSGVLLAEGLVLTAGHVVAESDQVWVLASDALPVSRSWPEFSPGRLQGKPASNLGLVRMIDTRRDLALVSFGSGPEVAGKPGSEVELVNLGPGQDVVILGVADPDQGSGTVVKRVRIITNEVRGTNRIERLGLVVDAPTAIGDSGAGIWLNEKLAGIIFAVSTADSEESWAVDGSEIAGLLADWHDTTGDPEYRCNPDESEMDLSER